MLEVKDLCVRYGDLTILRDVSFSLPEGEWLMICGPNGAGKSTLMSALSRGVPHTGTVLLDGADVRKLKPRALARKMGVLAQNHFVGYAFTVGEVVRLGRYAYGGGALGTPGEADKSAVIRALALTGMTTLEHQSVLTLSGGELQRAFLAQLFAQDPQLLLLDEPTNHLDLVYQQQVFGLIRDWIARTGRSVISVVHDLSLARAFGTRALLLNKGVCAAQGTVSEVLTRENLQQVYSTDVYAWMHRMLTQWEDKDES